MFRVRVACQHDDMVAVIGLLRGYSTISVSFWTLPATGTVLVHIYLLAGGAVRPNCCAACVLLAMLLVDVVVVFDHLLGFRG